MKAQPSNDNFNIISQLALKGAPLVIVCLVNMLQWSCEPTCEMKNSDSKCSKPKNTLSTTFKKLTKD